MVNLRALVLFCAGASVAAGAGLAFNHGGGQPAPSLEIFEGDNYDGFRWTITGDISNLDSIGANDSARSLRAQGRWEVCMDADFVTNCRIVDGDVADLGEDNGSMSSARYLGPDGRSAGQATTGHHRPSQPHARMAMSTRRSTPMTNIDLPGSDYRSFDLSAGQDVSTCQAACEDEDRCRAWTFVVPGSTDHGICYLKDNVPDAGPGECCVSGIIGR